MIVDASGDTVRSPSALTGKAYAVPDLQTGGPIMKMNLENGRITSLTPVVFLKPDPGYRICRAVLKSRGCIM